MRELCFRENIKPELISEATKECKVIIGEMQTQEWKRKVEWRYLQSKKKLH